jgi:hypothetical protein
MRPAQLASLVLAILLAGLVVAPHLAIIPATGAVYIALAVAVLTVIARFLPAFSPTQIPANIADELATIVGGLGAVYGAAAPILLTIPGLHPGVIAWASSVVALLGAMSAAVLPAPVKHPVEQFGGLRCLLPWALLLSLGLAVSGCNVQQTAAWKQLGIDARACASPAIAPTVAAGAKDLTAVLTGDGVTLDTVKAQGLALVAQYGVDTALCILAAAYHDLGPVIGIAGEPESSPRPRLAWLVAHRAEWVPAK